jgi:hypothetical protein
VPAASLFITVTATAAAAAALVATAVPVTAAILCCCSHHKPARQDSRKEWVNAGGLGKEDNTQLWSSTGARQQLGTKHSMNTTYCIQQVFRVVCGTALAARQDEGALLLLSFAQDSACCQACFVRLTYGLQGCYPGSMIVQGN